MNIALQQIKILNKTKKTFKFWQFIIIDIIDQVGF
jgi:hypothetical protein